MPIRKWDDDNPNILSAEELGRVLAWVKKESPQHYALIVLLAFTGVRSGWCSRQRRSLRMTLREVGE